MRRRIFDVPLGGVVAVPLRPLPAGETSKAIVAEATAAGVGKITMEEALRRYQLTEEEFLSWQRSFEGHGLAGLRTTRLQQYREPRPSRRPRSRR